MEEALQRRRSRRHRRFSLAGRWKLERRAQTPEPPSSRLFPLRPSSLTKGIQVCSPPPPCRPGLLSPFYLLHFHRCSSLVSPTPYSLPSPHSPAPSEALLSARSSRVVRWSPSSLGPNNSPSLFVSRRLLGSTRNAHCAFFVRQGIGFTLLRPRNAGPGSFRLVL